MDNLGTVVVAAAVGAIFGTLAILLREYFVKKKKRLEAIAKLRFELVSNRIWFGSVLSSLNYMRTEAWNTIKDEENILYLNPTLQRMIASVYDQIHMLNGKIKILKDGAPDTKGKIASNVRKITRELDSKIGELVGEIDKKYPRLAVLEANRE